MWAAITAAIAFARELWLSYRRPATAQTRDPLEPDAGHAARVGTASGEAARRAGQIAERGAK